MTRTEPAPVPFPRERSCPFDPPDGFARVREERPITRMVYPSGPVGWLVTGFAESRALLADPRFSARQELLLPPNTDNHITKEPAPPGVFNKTDPPEHTRYRRMLIGRFTLRRVKQLEPIVRRIAAEQLDALHAAGPGADLVEHYAEPLAGRVMCEILGIRESERKFMQGKLAVFGDPTGSTADMGRVLGQINGILTRLIRAKTARPGDDLVSDLLRSGELPPDEVLSVVLVMLLGGFDTTPNMLGLGVFLLLRRPEHLARLRGEPEIIERAVEEMLRYLTISHFGASRCALEDVEFEGHLIRKGEVVTFALNAANRDPRRFAAPDELDFDRDEVGHLGFGFGVHQCIGQNLARSTLRIGYQSLFARLPGLRLAAPAAQVELRSDKVHYGPAALPVSW